MQRLERLVDLVAALIDAHRPLTREQIRERIPAYPEDDASYKRAFERDKDALRQMNIPISVEPLEHDNADSPVGYRIRREDYELPDPGLDPDELAALHLAASAVRIGGGSAGLEAIWKLGGATSHDGGGAVADLPGSEHLPVLFAAIAERRTVVFGYLGGSRRVDPYFLSFRSGRWYLLGYDHDRDDRRTFRLDRIESAPEPGDRGAFERPETAPTLPPPWEMGDEDPVEARVRIDADYLDPVLARVGEAAVSERDASGAATVSLRVTNRPAFRAFVLDLLDHAEVVDPPELRSHIVDWLEAIAAQEPSA